MNISAWTIYLWQLADKLELALGVTSFIFGMFSFASIFAFFVVRASPPNKEYFKLTRNCLITILSLFFLISSAYTLAPSSKTIAMMVVIPEIAKSKMIQKDLPDIYNAAVEALKGAIKHE